MREMKKQAKTTENQFDFIETANISIAIIRDSDEVYYSENLNVTLGEKYES